MHLCNKTTKKESVLWIKTIDLGKKLDIKNICDSVDKEIRGKFKDNYPTKEQIKKYKKHGSELIKSEKVMYGHEDIIIPIIRGSRSPKSIEFRSKLEFT